MSIDDSIYAKNRHFYGGIEPSVMREFEASMGLDEDGFFKVKITATLPENTVINDQTMCTVAGAVIRRKVNDIPENEFDGDFIADIKESCVFFDSTAESGTTYCYMAFPYSTKDVYSCNKENVSVLTVTDGYTPEPLTRFVAKSDFEIGSVYATIDMIHPGNTVINDETVSTLAGIVVRKSTTDYPLNETQGELVKDFKIADMTVTGNGYHVNYKDTAVVINTKYYYSAFPYNTSGLYNRNTINRASILVNAGKIPDDMEYFRAKAVCVGDKAVIYVDGDIPNNATSVPIRKKIGSAPTSINDGELVTTFLPTDPYHWTGHHRYEDHDVVDGVTYFYRAFPTSARGAVNSNDTDANKKSATAKERWIFAMALIDDQPNPDLAITYDINETEMEALGIDHIDNRDFRPAKMNFDTGVFDYGGWNFEPGTYFMPFPCVTDKNGTVQYYLNPNDYNMKTDGGISRIDYTYISTTEVYPVVEWTKFYSKSFDNIAEKRKVVAISNKPFGDKTRPIYNFASLTNNVYADHFYTTIYMSSGNQAATDRPVVSSVSCVRYLYGSEQVPTQYTTSYTDDNMNRYSNTYPENVFAHTHVDDGVGMFQAIDLEMIQYLLMLMSKSLNLYEKYGYEFKRKSKNMVAGHLNKKGMFYGYDHRFVSTDEISGVKVFGIEDLWYEMPIFLGGIGITRAAYPINDTNPTDYTLNRIVMIFKTVSPWAQRSISQYGPNSGTYSGFPVRAPKRGLNKILKLYWDQVLTEGDITGYPIDFANEIGNGYISKLMLSESMDMGDFFMVVPVKGTDTATIKKKNNLTGSSTTYVCDYVWVPMPTNFTDLGGSLTGDRIGEDSWSQWKNAQSWMDFSVFTPRPISFPSQSITQNPDTTNWTGPFYMQIQRSGAFNTSSMQNYVQVAIRARITKKSNT